MTYINCRNCGKIINQTTLSDFEKGICNDCMIEFIERRNESEKCFNCEKCKDNCCKSLLISLLPYERDKLKQLALQNNIKLKIWSFGDFHYIINGCPFLIKEKCIIYNDRPLRCKSFPLMINIDNIIDNGIISLTFDGFCMYETFNLTDQQLTEMYQNMIEFDTQMLGIELNSNKKDHNNAEKFKLKYNEEYFNDRTLKNAFVIGYKYFDDMLIYSIKHGLKLQNSYLRKMLYTLRGY